MNAATGELSLTVITIIAIGAVIAFFWLAFPAIKNSINEQWNGVSTYENENGGSGHRYR